MKCLTIRQYSVLSLHMHSLMPAVRHVYIEAGNVYLLIFSWHVDHKIHNNWHITSYNVCGTIQPMGISIATVHTFALHSEVIINIYIFCV